MGEIWPLNSVNNNKGLPTLNNVKDFCNTMPTLGLKVNVTDLYREVMQLKLAPGTVSGFKGVHKAGKKWEARLWVPGKGTRVVWRDESPKECAYILARLEVFPCQLPSPKKGRAKPGKGRKRVREQPACALAGQPGCNGYESSTATTALVEVVAVSERANL